MKRGLFLSSASFALMPGVSGVAQAADTMSPSPSIVTAPTGLVFDRATFDRILNSPQRHRQAFASSNLNGAAFIHYMRNSIGAYKAGFERGQASLNAVAVLYGTSCLAVCTDAAWKRFGVLELLASYGEKFPPTADPAFNPFRGEIDDLRADGASFLVCNNALTGVATTLATRAAPAVSPADVHAALLGMLLPGAIAVPAGVAAINALQEAKFTLFQASM